MNIEFKRHDYVKNDVNKVWLGTTWKDISQLVRDKKIKVFKDDRERLKNIYALLSDKDMNKLVVFVVFRKEDKDKVLNDTNQTLECESACLVVEDKPESKFKTLKLFVKNVTSVKPALSDSDLPF